MASFSGPWQNGGTKVSTFPDVVFPFPFFSNCLLLKNEALEELEFYIRIIIKEQ